MKSEKVKVKAIVVFFAVFLATVSGVSLSNTGNTQDNQSEIFVDYELNHAPSPPEFVPGEFIVRFKSDIDERAINTINTERGAYVKRTSRFVPEIKVLSVPQGKSVEEMVQLYERLPEVQYAEPSYIGYGFMVPNDTNYTYQWHFDNDEYGGINMESAWDISTGEGVVVAVLDSGVAYEDYTDASGTYCQAPDLAGTTFVQGYDIVNNDAHQNDDFWHGTHVAGTIAQTTNNGYGVAGVAFDCAIMPVKIANAADFEPGVKNMQKYITYLGSSNILRVKLSYP